MPPPNESTRSMDPLATLDLDLSWIVDDMMVPSFSAARPFLGSDLLMSSMYWGLVAEEAGVVHSTTASNSIGLVGCSGVRCGTYMIKSIDADGNQTWSRIGRSFDQRHIMRRRKYIYVLFLLHDSVC